MLVYHFMFGPDYTAGCPSCSAIPTASMLRGPAWPATTSRSARSHGLLSPNSHTYEQRMGWSFPVASSYGSDFKLRLRGAHTKTWEAGAVAYNFGHEDSAAGGRRSGLPATLSPRRSSHELETTRREGPGMSAFARQDEHLPHVLHVRAGTGILWGITVLDRGRVGRNEAGMWLASPRRDDSSERCWPGRHEWPRSRRLPPRRGWPGSMKDGP